LKITRYAVALRSSLNTETPLYLNDDGKYTVHIDDAQLIKNKTPLMDDKKFAIVKVVYTLKRESITVEK